MARTGRFGTLPAAAPELTSTIVALMEEYERQRDRNILSAWQSGGDFEGKPVTDERLKEWFLNRKSQYTKQDPEYDYWDQQYQQIDYDIEESKMLLRYAQSSVNSKNGSAEAMAAGWYTRNARRFPKDSEAWREAMRNAAQYRKAAQERTHATNTVSDYEKYTKAVTTLQRNKVDPAIKAMGIVDEALARMGVTPDGFMSLDANQRAAAQTRIEEFIRDDPDGARFGRQWKRLTGQSFSYNGMRKVLRTGKEGSNQQAAVARKFGYSPQQYIENARQFGSRDTALSVFRSNIMDTYIEQSNEYQADIANAKTPEERIAARADYAKFLRAQEKKADEMGDSVLAGSLRAKRANVLGQGNGIYDIQYPEQTMAPSATAAAGDRELHLNPDGSLNISMYATDAEKDWAYAQYDLQAMDHIRDGSYVMVDQKGDGTLIPVDLKKLQGGNPTTEQYASFPKTMADGTVTTVYVPWAPINVTIHDVTGGSTTFELPNSAVAVLDGKTVYKTLDGDHFITTNVPPFDDTGSVEDPLYQTTRDRSETTWGDIKTGEGATVYGMQVTINVTPEDAARLAQAGVTQTGETPEQVRQRVALTRQQIVGVNDRQAVELGTMGPSDRPNADAAAAEQQAQDQHRWDSVDPGAAGRSEADRHALAAEYGRQWNTSHHISPQTMTPEQAQQQSEWVTQRMREDHGYHVNATGSSWVTNSEDPVRSALPPERKFTMPPVYSDALKSKDDLSGASVAFSGSRTSRDEAVKSIPIKSMFDHVLKANGVDPKDVVRQYDLSKEVNGIFGVGAPGTSEEEYIMSRPGASLSDVEAERNFVLQFHNARANIQAVGQNIAGVKPGGLFSWLTAQGGGNLTYDQAVAMFPELEPDISGAPSPTLGPPTPSRLNLRDFFDRFQTDATNGVTGAPTQPPVGETPPSLFDMNASPNAGIPNPPTPPPPTPAPAPTPEPPLTPEQQRIKDMALQTGRTLEPTPPPAFTKTFPMPTINPFGTTLPKAKAPARYDPARFQPVSYVPPPAFTPPPMPAFTPPPVGNTAPPLPQTTSWVPPQYNRARS